MQINSWRQRQLLKTTTLQIISKTMNPGFYFSYSKNIIFLLDIKFLLIFKFGKHWTKKPFVSTAYNALIGTLISTGDLSISLVSVKLSEVETEGLRKAKHCKSESPGNYVPCARHPFIELVKALPVQSQWSLSTGNHLYLSIIKREIPEHRCFNYGNQFLKTTTLGDSLLCATELQVKLSDRQSVFAENLNYR